MAEFGRNLKAHLVPPPAMEPGSRPVQPGLECVLKMHPLQQLWRAREVKSHISERFRRQGFGAGKVRNFHEWGMLQSQHTDPAGIRRM